ncbi:hypothetical protein [Spiroplasma alleghenense]|uniref:Uncharacterized protein n=1 Tax=Spiroplasma alleghenense TaxID=216931 RepID=A0A345Z2U3_9MOLU|nr:hypothetical protein [Spiroplasma alleghenense]AXK50922.1 hypothetical protein SALLE_v1c02460 [Spiroplasma alleghenense]
MKNSPIKVYTKNLIKEANENSNDKVSLKDIKWPVNEPWNVNNSRYQKLYISWMDKVEFLHILNNKNIAKIKIQNLKVNQLTRMQNNHNDMAYAVNKIAKSLKLADSFLIAYVDYVNSIFSVGNEMIATTATYVNRRVAFEDIKGPIYEPGKILCHKYQKVYIDWLELINQIKKMNNYNLTMIRQGKWELMKIRRESSLYNQKVSKVNSIARYLQLADNFIVAKVDYLNEDYIKKAQIDNTVVSSKEEIKFREIIGPIFDPSRVNNRKYQRLYSYWLEEINNLKIIHNRNIDLISDGLISERKIEKLQNEYNYLVKDVNELFEELKLADRYRVARVNYFINVYEKKYYQEDAGEMTYNEIDVKESGVPFLTVDKPLELDLSEKNYVETMEAQEVVYKKVIKDIQDTQKVLDDFVNFEEFTEVLQEPEAIVENKTNEIIEEDVDGEDYTDYTITDDDFDVTFQNINDTVEGKPVQIEDTSTANFIKEHALFDWNGRPVYNGLKEQLIASPEMKKLNINNVYDEDFQPLFSDDKELPYGYSLFDWLGDQVYDELGNFIVEEVKIKFEDQKPKTKKDDTQYIKFIPQPKDPIGTKLYDWHGNPVFDADGKQLETDGVNAQIPETEVFDINGDQFILDAEKLPYTKALFNKNGFKSLDVLEDEEKPSTPIKGIPAAEYYAQIKESLPVNSTELEVIEEDIASVPVKQEEPLIIIKKPSGNNGTLLFDKNGKLVFNESREPLEFSENLAALDYSGVLNSNGKPLTKANKSDIELFDSQRNLIFDKNGFIVEKELSIPDEFKEEVKFIKKPIKEDGILLFDCNNSPVFDKNKNRLLLDTKIQTLDPKNVFDSKGRSILKNKENQVFGLALFSADKEQVFTRSGELIYKDVLVEYHDDNLQSIKLTEETLANTSNLEKPILLFDRNNEPLFNEEGEQLVANPGFEKIDPSKVFNAKGKPAFKKEKHPDLSAFDRNKNPIFNSDGNLLDEQKTICSLPIEVNSNSENASETLVEPKTLGTEKKLAMIGTLVFDKKGRPVYGKNKEQFVIEENINSIIYSNLFNEKSQPLFSESEIKKSDLSLYDFNKNKIVDSDGTLAEVNIKEISKPTPVFDIDGNQIFNAKKEPLLVRENNINEVILEKKFDKKGKPLKLQENKKALFTKEGRQIANKNGEPLKENINPNLLNKTNLANGTTEGTIQTTVLAMISEPVVKAGTQLFTENQEPVFTKTGEPFITDGSISAIQEPLYNKDLQILIDPLNNENNKSLFDKNGKEVFTKKGQPVLEVKEIEIVAEEIKTKTSQNGEEIKYIEKPIVNLNEQLYLTDGTPVYKEDGTPLTLQKSEKNSPEKIFNKNNNQIKYPENKKVLIDENGLVAFDENGNLKVAQITLEEKPVNKLNDKNKLNDEKIANILEPNFEKPILVQREVKTPIAKEGEPLFTKTGKPVYDIDGNQLLTSKSDLKIIDPVFDKKGNVIFNPEDLETDKSLYSKKGQQLFDRNFEAVCDTQTTSFNPETIETKTLENGQIIEVVKTPNVDADQQLFLKDGTPVYNQLGEPLVSKPNNELIDQKLFNKKGKDITRDIEKSKDGKVLFDKFGKEAYSETGQRILKEDILGSVEPENDIQLNKIDKPLSDSKVLNHEDEEFIAIVKSPVAPTGTQLFTKNQEPVFSKNGEPIMTDGQLAKISEVLYTKNGEVLFAPTDESTDKSLFDKNGSQIYQENGKPVLENKEVKLRSQDIKIKKLPSGEEIKYIEKPIVELNEQLFLADKTPVYNADKTPLLLSSELKAAPEKLFTISGNEINNKNENQTLVDSNGVVVFDEKGKLKTIKEPITKVISGKSDFVSENENKNLSLENDSNMVSEKDENGFIEEDAQDYKQVEESASKNLEQVPPTKESFDEKEIINKDNLSENDKYSSNKLQKNETVIAKVKSPVALVGTQLFTKDQEPVFDEKNQPVLFNGDLGKVNYPIYDKNRQIIFAPDDESIDKSLFNNVGQQVYKDNGKPVLETKEIKVDPEEIKTKVLPSGEKVNYLEKPIINYGEPLLLKDKTPVYNADKTPLIFDKQLAIAPEKYYSENGNLISNPDNSKILTNEKGVTVFDEKGKLKTIKEPILETKTDLSQPIQKFERPTQTTAKIKTAVVEMGTPLFTKDLEPVYKADGSQFTTDGKLAKIWEPVYDKDSKLLFDPKDEKIDKSLFSKNGEQVYKPDGKPVLQTKEVAVNTEEIKTKTLSSGQEIKYIEKSAVESGKPLLLKDGTPVYKVDGQPLLQSDILKQAPEIYYSNDGRQVKNIDNTKTLVTENGVIAFDENGKLKTIKEPISEIFEKPLDSKLDKLISLDNEKQNTDEIIDKFNDNTLKKAPVEKLELFEDAAFIQEEDSDDLEIEINEFDDDEFEIHEEELDSMLEEVKVEKTIEVPVAPIGTLLYNKDKKPVYDASGKQIIISKNKNPIIDGIYDSNRELIFSSSDRGIDKTLFDNQGRQVLNSDGKLITEPKTVLVNPSDIKNKTLPNGEEVEVFSTPNVESGIPLFLKDGTRVYDKKGDQLKSTGTTEPLRTEVYNKDGQNLFKDPKNYQNGKSLFTQDQIPVYDISGSAVLNDNTVYQPEDKNILNPVENNLSPAQKEEPVVLAKVKTPVAPVGTQLFTKNQEPVKTASGKPLLTDGQVSRINQPVYDNVGKLLFTADDKNSDKSLYDSKGQKVYSESGKPVLETKEIKVSPEEIKVKSLPNGEKIEYIETPIVEYGEPLFLSNGNPVYNLDGTPLLFSKELNKAPETLYNSQSEPINNFAESKELVDKKGQPVFDDQGKPKTIKKPVTETKTIKETEKPVTENKAIKEVETTKPIAKPIIIEKIDESILKTDELILLEPIVESGTLLFDKKGEPVYDGQGNQLTAKSIDESIVEEMFDAKGKNLNPKSDDFDKKPHLFDQQGNKVTDSSGALIVKESIISVDEIAQNNLDDEVIEVIVVPVAKNGTKLYTNDNKPVFYSSGQPVKADDNLVDYDFSDIYNAEGDLILEENENKELFDSQGTQVIEDGKMIKVKRAIRKKAKAQKDLKAKEKARIKENIDKANRGEKPVLNNSNLNNVFDEANSRLGQIREELKQITNDQLEDSRPKSAFDKLSPEFEDDYKTDYDLIDFNNSRRRQKEFTDDLQPIPQMNQNFVPKQNGFFDKIEDRMSSIENMLAILTHQEKTMDSDRIRILREDIERIYSDLNNINSSVPKFGYNSNPNRKANDFDICGCSPNGCGSQKRKHHVYNAGNNSSQRHNDFRVANFSHHHNCHHQQKDGRQFCEHCGKTYKY